MRAFPIQRILANDAAGMTFRSQRGDMNALVVFSPIVFMPVIAAKAVAIARHVFGPEGDQVLGLQRTLSDGAMFGLEATVGPLDGSPEGILRALIMTRASQQVFGFTAGRPQVIDLDAVAKSYETEEGREVLMGTRSDVIDLASAAGYDWSVK